MRAFSRAFGRSFNIVGGHEVAITNATIIPIIWASRLLRQLEDVVVVSARVNRTWQDELTRNGGDRVRLNEVGDNITVGDYVHLGNGRTSLTYPHADVGAAQDLILDKQKYWTTAVEDIVRAQSAPDLLDATMTQAAIRLRAQVDNDVRTVMRAGATAGADTELDHMAASLDADDFGFSKITRILNNAKCPKEGRWIIIGPYTEEVFIKFALQNNSAWTPAGQDVARNGMIGNYAGFDIYVDNDTGSVFTAGATANDPGKAVEELLAPTTAQPSLTR